MPASIGTHPRYLEELRIGGGYGSGADFDRAGNIETSGDIGCDGDAAVGGALHIAGNLDVDGLDTSWSTYLPATLGLPDPALPCGPLTTTNWRSYHVATPSLAFDPATPEAAYFQFRLPKGYDGRPLKFTIDWSATSAGSGDVRWGINPIPFDDLDSLVQTGPLNYTIDSFVGSNVLHFAQVAISLPQASGPLVTVRLIRDASSGLDTLDTSALILGLCVDI